MEDVRKFAEIFSDYLSTLSEDILCWGEKGILPKEESIHRSKAFKDISEDVLKRVDDYFSTEEEIADIGKRFGVKVD